jgi:choice-of-anchor A domain-containing protein
MVGKTSIDSFDSEDARYNTDGRYDPAKHKDGGYAASIYGNLTGQLINGSIGTGPTGVASGTVGDFKWTSSNSGIQPGRYANDVNFSFPEVQPPFDGGAATPTSGALTLTNYSFWTSVVTTATIPMPLPPNLVTNLKGTITTTRYPSGLPSNLITTNTTRTRTKTDPEPGSYLNLVVQGQWNEYDLITSYSYPSITYSYSTTGTNATVTTEQYAYVLSGDRYEVSNLRLSGGDRLIVTGKEVTLYIRDGFAMSGQSEFIIAPGASVKIYVGGDVALSGNGILNYSQNAASFELFGLPTNTKIAISGNAAFTGVIYAPQADVTMNGGGNDGYDVVGAIVANTAKLNGHFRFHYDEALGRAKILSRYSVASWRELNPDDSTALVQSY